MANYSISNQLNLSKERIQKVIEQAFKEQRILKYFQEENASLSEKYVFADAKYIIPFFDDIVPTARGVPEGGTVPGAGSIAAKRMTCTLEKVMCIQNVNWEVTQVGTKEAFVDNQVDRIKDQGKKAMMDACNTIIMGYSLTGAIAKIYSYNTPAMKLYRHDGTYADGSSEPGARYIRKSQPINIIDSDLSTVNSSGHTVTTVTDYETIQVTGCTAANGDYIVPGDANGSQFGEVPTGLWQHVNNADVTYQGLTTRLSSYPQLCGNVLSNSGTSRDLSSGLLWQALDAPLERLMGDANTVLVFGSPTVIRNYGDIFDDLYRFAPDDGPRTPKHRSATIPNQGGKQIKPLIEPQCQPGRLYLIDTSSFKLLHNGQLYAFEPNDAGGVLHRVQTAWATDAYEIRGRAYFQIPCEAPALNSVITDINDAPVSGYF